MFDVSARMGGYGRSSASATGDSTEVERVMRRDGVLGGPGACVVLVVGLECRVRLRAP